MIQRLLFIATALALHPSTNAFLVPTSHRLIQPSSINLQTRQSSIHPPTTLQIFGNDEKSTIPPELRDEIYAAEAATPTAQTRPQRIATYALLTFAGVSVAFFNAFLSDLRFGEGSPSSDLGYYGFGWVTSNFLTSFLFTNKIGGGFGLLGAGLSGTLLEVEIRSKKENAEKIWEEMQRRKTAREISSTKKSKKNRSGGSIPQSTKRSMTGKQKKRISALEELMEDSVNDDGPVSDNSEQSTTTTADGTSATPQISPETPKQEDKGIFSTIKNFYDKADSMAASQALLLNKELEDRGVIDKITDESGLKVIGKEAAEKLKKEREG